MEEMIKATGRRGNEPHNPICRREANANIAFGSRFGFLEAKNDLHQVVDSDIQSTAIVFDGEICDDHPLLPM